MNVLVMLIAALLPAALLSLYILRKDAQPEPTNWLAKAFFYGVGICIPVALLELAIEATLFGGAEASLVGVTLQSFFVAALPEEGFKLLALWLVLRKNPYFDEHFDGIVYAVCVGLGFASIENVGYVLSADEWLSVSLARAFLAVPGHYAFGVLMGYYYSVYHFVDRSPRTRAYILLVPVVAHGIYDSIAFSSALSPVLAGVSSLLLILFCVRMHNFANRKIVAQLMRDAQEVEEMA